MMLMIQQKISFIDRLLSECCWADKSKLKVLAVMEQTCSPPPPLRSSLSGLNPLRTNLGITGLHQRTQTHRHAGACKLSHTHTLRTVFHFSDGHSTTTDRITCEGSGIWVNNKQQESCSGHCCRKHVKCPTVSEVELLWQHLTNNRHVSKNMPAPFLKTILSLLTLSVLRLNWKTFHILLLYYPYPRWGNADGSMYSHRYKHKQNKSV